MLSLLNIISFVEAFVAMEGMNNHCLAKIKRTGHKTIVPISYVYKKNGNGKFQQATSEHAKLNVGMYMKVPGKEFEPISILRFRGKNYIIWLV